MLKHPLHLKLQPERVIQIRGFGSDSENVIKGICLYPILASIADIYFYFILVIDEFKKVEIILKFESSLALHRFQKAVCLLRDLCKEKGSAKRELLERRLKKR
jgi:hypothetical protein